MLTDQHILQRYVAKQAEFEKVAQITLIGHSLFDMWDDLPQNYACFADKNVANLGISGVSTRQYLEIIIQPGRIRKLGNHVFVFLGVNDIAKEPDYSPKGVADWLNAIFYRLKAINPIACFYFLEATPVNNIATVSNEEIRTLNQYLQMHMPEGVTFVPTQPAFCNSEGELSAHFHLDGLHFNALGYEILGKILAKYI
ncbi:MAG TPA: acylneuraminate cytidylyltransferase [Pasteurellaceae bacterium]|nr:acylneuraminate cytidylyltransferase [Pasteurellaceae bacterium]